MAEEEKKKKKKPEEAVETPPQETQTPTQTPKFEEQIITPSTEQDERGFLNKLLKTEEGQFKTDIAGQYTAKTGTPVAAQPIPLVSVPSPTNIKPLLSAGPTAVSKAAQVGKLVRAGTVRGTLQNFASNAKTAALTKGFMIKLGLTVGVAALLKDAIGTYPYAGFIKEEALQTLGFAVNAAKWNKDEEGLKTATAEIDEILNAAPTIIDKIPYANVQKQLRKFFEAAEIKNNIDKAGIEKMRTMEEEKAGRKGTQGSLIQVEGGLSAVKARAN